MTTRVKVAIIGSGNKGAALVDIDVGSVDAVWSAARRTRFVDVALDLVRQKQQADTAVPQ